jgi:hypothetical protein
LNLTTILWTRFHEKYCGSITTLFENMPSLFIWNVDEAKVGCPRKTHYPRVIVSIGAAHGAVSTAMPKLEAQMTMVAAISALGHATIPFSKSSNQTFQNDALAIHMRFDGRKYIVRSTEKPLITEIVSVDWLKE